MRLAVLGLSISSAWGNGHATTWRALLKGLAHFQQNCSRGFVPENAQIQTFSASDPMKSGSDFIDDALARRGWDIVFLEREQPWYAAHRDLPDPGFCSLFIYEDLAQHRDLVAAADAVLIGSYVPQGADVIEQVLAWARGPVLFYDIDTPVTLAALERGACAYLRREQIPRFAAYLSFTGGPTLVRLQRQFAANRVEALYCCADPGHYRPVKALPRWDLSYLGTYSPDRQPALERLLLQPARARPELRFCVAGPQYPQGIDWPANVERIPHLAPAELPAFYCASRFTLNLTRAEMAAAGFSPSVRLFEAAACATPILTDRWPGLEECFSPGSEILPVEDGAQTLAALGLSEAERAGLGRRARMRALLQHSGAARARRLEATLHACLAARAAAE